MSAEPSQLEAREVERPLVVLMAARLVLALSGLVIGVALDLATLESGNGPSRGFYATVTAMFLATAAYRRFAGRVRRLRLFGAINMVTDMLLVSGLVVFSGGLHSVFTFCYVVVGLYGGLLFPAWGAVLCAASGAATYAAVLAAGQAGWLGPGVQPEPLGLLVTNWAAHAAALLGSSALSGFLARELARTGEALDERTQDLAQLRTLHERTVESLRSGLLTTDLSQCITSFNREAERITGWTRSRALGRHVEDLLPGLHGRIRRAREEEPDLPPRFRMEYVGPRRETMHLGFGVYTLHDAGGQTGGEVVIFQDVTTVVGMERELRRSERLAAVGELSASIAHEIRNPLAAISGSVQMMDAHPGAEPGEKKRLREIVIREVDRLDQLIDEFLQYARPGEPRIESVRLDEVVAEVVEMISAAGTDVTLERSIEPALAVWADPGQLRQVLWNLLLNAAQAMPDGGRLRIEGRPGAAPQGEPAGDRIEAEAGKPAGWAEIAVLDQGGGIPPEVAEHMFDPFFTTKSQGTGLGLAMVHRVVQEHGGSLRVEAGSGDFDTAIRLRLPRAGA